MPLVLLGWRGFLSDKLRQVFSMLKIAVVGATGYTGKEVGSDPTATPHARPYYVTSTSFAGQSFRLSTLNFVDFVILL